jgi:hypothetical protein
MHGKEKTRHFSKMVLYGISFNNFTEYTAVMSFKYSSLKSASVLQIAKEVLLSLTCAVFIVKAILWYWRFQLLKFTTICLLRSLSSVHFIHVSI